MIIGGWGSEILGGGGGGGRGRGAGWSIGYHTRRALHVG